MKIVAVAACLTDFAHAYLVAEQLEQTGRRLGHTIKVETQGRMGIECELTAQDIREADAVIVAGEARILGRRRFADIGAIVHVRIQDAFLNPLAVFDTVLEHVTI
jgi:fructose-specific phosphotransferase system IIB component